MVPPKSLFTTSPAAAPTAAQNARPIGESLAGADGLAGLLARVRASQARLEALADVLPDPLRQHVRAGPLDDQGWTLLALNAAVAAKLRHLLPLLAETLVAKGWQATSIRVKVQSTHAPR
ncbi:MAG: hypothetical protein ABW032_00455 [Burkholderiaceae bacterium]